MSEVDSQPRPLPEDHVALAMAPLHAPAAAAMVMADKVRADIVAGMRKRADWLRDEYLKGGDFEYLSLRERECRYLATQIEEGKI